MRATVSIWRLPPASEALMTGTWFPQCPVCWVREGLFLFGFKCLSGGASGLIGAGNMFCPHCVTLWLWRYSWDSVPYDFLRPMGTHHRFTKDSAPVKVFGRMLFRAWLLQGPHSAFLRLVLRYALSSLWCQAEQS